MEETVLTFTHPTLEKGETVTGVEDIAPPGHEQRGPPPRRTPPAFDKTLCEFGAEFHQRLLQNDDIKNQFDGHLRCHPVSHPLHQDRREMFLLGHQMGLHYEIQSTDIEKGEILDSAIGASGHLSSRNERQVYRTQIAVGFGDLQLKFGANPRYRRLLPFPIAVHPGRQLCHQLAGLSTRTLENGILPNSRVPNVPRCRQ